MVVTKKEKEKARREGRSDRALKLGGAGGHRRP